MYTQKSITPDKISALSLSQMLHEIRNPLTLIYSTIQLIEDKYTFLGQDELWVQLNEDIIYLKDLTASLSDFAHSQSLKIKKTDIRQIFEELNNYWSTYAKLHKRHLIFETAPDLPNQLCDPVKLKQCLFNLIKNSFEATSEGCTVRISADTDDDFLILSVSDTGYGMTDEQINHIFEPYTTYKADGHGMGLAITKAIVLAHHGTITAISENNTTRFTILLPLAQTD